MKVVWTMLVGVLVVGVFNTADAASLFTAFTKSFGPHEEVTYTLVRRGEGYEERHYQAKYWVCSGHQGTGYSESEEIETFFRLFAYIGGDNSRHTKLMMGIPVSIQHGVSDQGEELYTACFFIPEGVQSDPPTPTDAKVFLTLRPEMTVLTRKFGGYATDRTSWGQETDALLALVTQAGERVTPNLAFWNAYDPPFKFWNRRNEVWLVAS